MRLLSIFLVLLLVGAASAAWYPRSENYTTSGAIVGAYLDMGRGIDIANTSPSTIHGALQVDGALTAAGGVTGTASRVAIGSFIDTGYGLMNSTANKAQVNLSADMGLMFDTGARAGALAVDPGDGIDVGSAGVSVDVTDIVDESQGLTETGTNNISVNLSASSGLEFGTGASLGAMKVKLADASLSLSSSGLQVKAEVMKRTLAAGTAAGVNVTVSEMVAGDELISVISYTTAAAIASAADRTAEYTTGSGILVKTAGTNETGNQLDILWLDRTA